MMRTRALGGLVVALGGWASSSCAPSGFPGASLVTSVRILASSADRPDVTPGSPVNVRVLAYDGRTTKPAPMTTHWIPFVCKDPPDDAYYACFGQFAGGGPGDGGPSAAPVFVTPCDGGSGDSGAPQGGLQPGVDLGLSLPSGDCASFTMPDDAISAHSNNPPPPVPYGLAILFNIACAGRLELVPLDPNNAQAPPIGCFDAQHNLLGPSDYVFGFTRVYAYKNNPNTNPSIESVHAAGASYAETDAGQADGGPIPDQMLSINADGTTATISPDCSTGTCSGIDIGPVVPASSQEVDNSGAAPQKEQIWAEFFSTFGSFTDDVRLLYDVNGPVIPSGRDKENQFQAPIHAGDGMIWIVVHDNRGGASWVAVPVTVP
jgi:hypothetical protein